MFENENDLLTRSDCQRLLKVSKSTMIRLIHENYIPATLVCGSYRILKDDLILFINNSIAYHQENHRTKIEPNNDFI